MASSVKTFNPILQYLLLPVLMCVTLLFISSGRVVQVFFLIVCLSVPLFMVVQSRFVSRIPVPAFFIYGFILFQTVFWATSRAYFHYAFGAILLLLPIVAFEYSTRVREKRIPLLGAFGIMILGCLVSYLRQMILYHGAMNYPFGYDRFFLIGIAVFLLIYFLLHLNILTVRHVLIVHILSFLPILFVVFFRYGEIGKIEVLLSERVGSSIEIGPNLISAYLDIAFPLSLFLAIHEKKSIKKICMSVLAAVYGLTLLAASSRGSVFGFIAVIAYLALRSRSIKRVIIILAFASIPGFLVGSKMFTRLVAPDRADMISNLGRVELLRSGFKILKENNFVFGIGMDNFAKDKFNFGFPSWFDTKRVMSSHDTHLELWLGWGLIGLVGWLYLWIGGIIYTARIKPQSEYAYLKPPIILAIIAFFSHGFFDSSLGSFPFLLHLFFFLACVSYILSREQTAARHAIFGQRLNRFQ